MKCNFITKAIVFFLLLTGMTSHAMATADTDPITENRETRAIQLQKRLEQIKAMDKTALHREEKKSLRHEVREIKKELAALGGGVYLSIGAIILVALLLILLL